MYASIHRYAQMPPASDDVIHAGRQLAAALQRLPGFVAYVLIDAGDGVLVALSLFEDEASLLATERVPALDGWLVAEQAVLAAGQPSVMSGEVVVQKGL